MIFLSPGLLFYSDISEKQIPGDTENSLQLFYFSELGQTFSARNKIFGVVNKITQDRLKVFDKRQIEGNIGTANFLAEPPFPAW